MNFKKIWEEVSPYRSLIIPVLIGALILILYFVIKHKDNKAAELQLKYDVATAQMKVFRDKDSLQSAKILVFQAEKAKDLLKIKSKDSSILFLQAEVKKYKDQIKEPGSSVTTVTNTTNASGTIPTVVTPSTIPGKPPVYSGDKSTEWMDLFITASMDTIGYKLAIRNKYSVVIGYEKGLPFALVKNFNPNTETTTLKTFQVEVPKPKRLGIGIQTGYGFTANGASPYIGVGISYNIFFLKL